MPHARNGTRFLYVRNGPNECTTLFRICQCGAKNITNNELLRNSCIEASAKRSHPAPRLLNCLHYGTATYGIMKFFFDFFPILLFFIAYKLSGIYTATAVAIAATAAQVAFFRFKHRRVEKMHLITLVLIATLGGATLLLQDKSFFMWKPTAVNWLFALAFLSSQLIGRKPLVERMMSHSIEVPSAVWRRLNISWVIFFVLMGVANLYVANRFFEAQSLLESVAGIPVETEQCGQLTGQVHELCLEAKAREDNWVDFKLFGMLGLTLAFVVAQAFYLSRHVQPNEQTDGER